LSIKCKILNFEKVYVLTRKLAKFQILNLYCNMDVVERFSTKLISNLKLLFEFDFSVKFFIFLNKKFKKITFWSK
jgi:hypothetical protein